MRAFVAEQNDDGVVREVRDLDESDLGEGDVLVQVAYSSVNYKDALAASGKKGQVARISPLIPGIDLAGDGVLAHGYDLGVAHHGGYAEYARVPSDWIVPLPDGLSARQAMAIGTAGYTAALSHHRARERRADAGLRAGAGDRGERRRRLDGRRHPRRPRLRGRRVLRQGPGVPARARRVRGDLTRGRDRRSRPAAGQAALGGRGGLRRRRRAGRRAPLAALRRRRSRRAATPAA